MSSLFKHWIMRFIKAAWLFTLIVIPFVWIKNTFNIRWAIIVMVIGFFIYWKTEDKIMNNSNYIKLNPKQKKIVCYIEIGMAVVLIVLSFTPGIGLKTRVIGWLCAILILWLSISSLREVDKNGK